MERVDVLVAEYLDGALDGARANELAGLLEADPAARHRFAALLADHRVLGATLAAEPEGAFARRVVDAIARDENGFARSVMEDLARKSAARLTAVTTWARRRRLLAGAGTAAAALLLAIGAYYLADTWPAPAARVVSVVGDVAVARGPETIPAATGLDLRAGDALRLPAGSTIAFRYPDGTRVEAEPGSRLALATEAGAKRIALREGSLSAIVAPQPAGRPMTFATPHAEARVVGTRLALAAGKSETRLEVTEGRVRLVRTADRRAVDVAAGFRAVAAPSRPLAAEPMELVVRVADSAIRDRYAPRYVRMAEGSLMYTDRGYEITRMPAVLRGHVAVLLPNTEREWTVDRYVTLEVNRPVDVFIGYDHRAFVAPPHLPPWMAGYDDTTMRIFSRTAGDTTFHVYRKAYPEGRIVLGGNLAGGDTGARENYLVIVAPRGAVPEKRPR